MCEPTTTAALVGLAISAAGTGVTVYDQHQTAERQDQANAESIRRQQQIQTQADQQVGQTVNKLKASNDADHGAAGLDQYLQQLRSTTPNNQQAFGSPGVSSAYDALAGADLQATNDRATGQAKLLSRIDAPAVQRQGEGAAVAGLGTLLGSLQNDSGAESYLNRVRLAGIHDNPWAQLAGQTAQTYGNYYAANGGRSTGNTSTGNGYGNVSSTYNGYGPVSSGQGYGGGRRH